MRKVTVIENVIYSSGEIQKEDFSEVCIGPIESQIDEDDVSGSIVIPKDDSITVKIKLIKILKL